MTDEIKKEINMIKKLKSKKSYKLPLPSQKPHCFSCVRIFWSQEIFLWKILNPCVRALEGDEKKEDENEDLLRSIKLIRRSRRWWNTKEVEGKNKNKIIDDRKGQIWVTIFTVFWNDDIIWNSNFNTLSYNISQPMLWLQPTTSSR